MISVPSDVTGVCSGSAAAEGEGVARPTVRAGHAPLAGVTVGLLVTHCVTLHVIAQGTSSPSSSSSPSSPSDLSTAISCEKCVSDALLVAAEVLEKRGATVVRIKVPEGTDPWSAVMTSR